MEYQKIVTKYHILLVLELLNRGAMGRYALGDKLGASDAAVRSILKKCQEEGYTETSGKSSGRRGTRLSEKGKDFIVLNRNHYAILFDEARIPDSLGLEGKCYCIATLNIEVPVSDILPLRDIAVRNGAEGAVILVRNRLGNWTFPNDDEGHDPVPEFAGLQGNCFVLTFGTDEGGVNLGTISIIYTLLGEETQLIPKDLELKIK